MNSTTFFLTASHHTAVSAIFLLSSLIIDGFFTLLKCINNVHSIPDEMYRDVLLYVYSICCRCGSPYEFIARTSTCFISTLVFAIKAVCISGRKRLYNLSAAIWRVYRVDNDVAWKEERERERKKKRQCSTVCAFRDESLLRLGSFPITIPMRYQREKSALCIFSLFLYRQKYMCPCTYYWRIYIYSGNGLLLLFFFFFLPSILLFWSIKVAFVSFCRILYLNIRANLSCYFSFWCLYTYSVQDFNRKMKYYCDI